MIYDKNAELTEKMYHKLDHSQIDNQLYNYFVWSALIFKNKTFLDQLLALKDFELDM